MVSFLNKKRKKRGLERKYGQILLRIQYLKIKRFKGKTLIFFSFYFKQIRWTLPYNPSHLFSFLLIVPSVFQVPSPKSPSVGDGLSSHCLLHELHMLGVSWGIRGWRLNNSMKWSRSRKWSVLNNARDALNKTSLHN